MSNKRKVWIASEFYYPIVTSTGYYITEIAENLADRGMEVHVVCTRARYNEIDNYEIKSYEIHNNVYIHRVLTTEIDKNNFFKRGCRLILSSTRMFFKLLTKVKKNDTLLAVTNPAFLILIIPILKKIRKIKTILLVHDIFPENLAAINKIGKESRIYKILSNLYNKAYRSFDVCISIGRDMSSVIMSKIIKQDSITLIPNWSDNKIVYPINKKNTNLCSQLKLDNKFVFQFAGNLGHAQGLDNILKAIELVKKTNLHFLFIGGGAKYNTIKTFTDNHKNTSLLSFQDRSKQNDFLNACDVAIVTLNDGMYGLGVPSKSYNIMAAGKPILMVGEPDSEIGLCIREYELGWIVNPDDPKALADAFESIYTNKDEIISVSEKARNVAETIFSKDVILEKYYNLLSSI